MKIDDLIAQCRNGLPEQRCAAIVDLEELQAKEAVPVLLELLTFPDVGVRANVAKALGNLGDEQVGPALLHLLEDSDELVRLNAAEALGQLKSALGLPALVRILEMDQAPLVRLHAAEALGDLNDRAALPALVKALSDQDEGVRAYAADAIGRLGIAEAQSDLRQQLEQEPNPFTKSFLLAALYRLGEEWALASLIQLSVTAEDTLAVTILNLAVEIVNARDAETLKSQIVSATQSRPTLHFETERLLQRLDSSVAGSEPPQ